MKSSPALKARFAGGLWLIVIAAAGFAMATFASLIKPDDAAATANNILASEFQFRLGVVADLVAAMCYVGVTVLLYVLLKPVSRTFSIFAAFFGLGGVTVLGPSVLSRMAPLLLLGGDDYLGVFTASQLQAMSLTSLKLHWLTLNVSLVLFGLQCVVAGYLIVRSAFLPSILGLLLAIGGAGYLLGSFANLISPSFGALLAPFIFLAAILGEGSLALWLLAKGVNVPRWMEQAG